MTTVASKPGQDLPTDNGTRIAIYDAMYEAQQQSSANGEHFEGLTEPELFTRVVGRLRVLVPRELHVAGEKEYLNAKLEVCLEAGILAERAGATGRLLTLTGRPPNVRMPSGEVIEYPAGLELARERLDRDNERLRAGHFDVRRYLPSIAYDPLGKPFQALLASMREHGFLRQFSIVKYDDGVIVDGLARSKAAEMVGINVSYARFGSVEERKAARQRDTPLARILIAVDSNAARLAEDVIPAVQEAVSGVTRRSWAQTAADLAFTRQWRQSTGSGYTSVFEVTRLPYRPGDEPKIQVDPEGRIMLRSLVQAAGLASYKINDLGPYVPFEQARTALSGRSALFARAGDLVSGIATMEADRRAKKQKRYPEWAQIREWIISNVPSADSDSPPESDLIANQDEAAVG